MSDSRFWSGAGTFAIGLGIGTLVALPVFMSSWEPANDWSEPEGEGSEKEQVVVVEPHPELTAAEVGAPVFIRIFKAERTLELWQQLGGEWVQVRHDPIVGMSGTLGPKQAEGDLQAPEGFYDVVVGRLKPDSDFHRAFNIGYPNAHDRAREWTGSFIMVHGGTASIGCFAMTDPVIEEIYDLVEAALAQGQRRVPVHAFPFRFTSENWEKHQESAWVGFWRNLEAGYRVFETRREVPTVRAEGKRYLFE